MTPKRYQRLCELFDRAQATPPERRAAPLDEVGAAGPTLRAELESMLADDRASRGEQFLGGPCPVNARDLRPAGDQPTVVGKPTAPNCHHFGQERARAESAALQQDLRIPASGGRGSRLLSSERAGSIGWRAQEPDHPAGYNRRRAMPPVPIAGR
jgi:hypothetical protein